MNAQSAADPSAVNRFLKSVVAWSALFLVIVLLAGLVDPRYLDPQHKQFLFLLGFIGMWRYSNAFMHYCRGMYFLYWKYPRMRKQADKLGDQALPSEIYMVVTSFRIPSHTTYRVYRSVFEEAARVGVPVTVIVSIVERSDEVLIKDILRRHIPDGAQVKLVIVRARGTGKRDGLAHAFRALSRQMPADDAVVGVVDGDTKLLPGCVANAVKFFKLLPTVGGITTNEFCEVEGSELIRQWHALRFAQRHVNMCSMAVSKRVLTMTGRLSFFRSKILIDPLFISDVEADHLDHWRLGRFQFLTGDDKSSWFSLMRAGWDTFYAPDSNTLTVEHPPEKNFFKATRQLMFRWYGNSLRQNIRTTKLLGYERLGLFTSYVLYDQRVSMWTCLLGLTVSLVASIIYGAQYIIIYFLWVAISRTIMTLAYAFSGHSINPMYPLVLYYNQVAGSAMKVYALFNMNKQSWTRQKTTLDSGSGRFDAVLNQVSSKIMLFSSLCIFFGAVSVLIHLTQRAY
ncbi:glycosyltransferase family 2 protein [Gilvimarinus sp. DA14]|uniref:glycosyltransferase family 2 protein n=1 Tax=Gilvimarinus sp. DA14 TaxID=2956798 RepID=UPI0020B7F032|nr:glycosyltransferase family 2 protein [Gilvimarinus sp. DA14]UTF59852.1 glycosyltransferase family 2 protein [Gilvimarinus sp. DA14]